MKKSTTIVLWCLFVSILALTACGSKDDENKSNKYTELSQVNIHSSSD